MKGVILAGGTGTYLFLLTKITNKHLLQFGKEPMIFHPIKQIVSAIITRSSNNFGPYQYMEKLIPRFIMNALMGKPLPVYGDVRNVRVWIYVFDKCVAIDLVRRKGSVGEIYNIASGDEKQNIEITRDVLGFNGKLESCIHYMMDWPGHDRCNLMDTGKLQKLGWKPKYRFETAHRETF